MKLFSWNVNGLRAGLRKGTFQEFLEVEQPEVLCLQEIKARPEQIDERFEGYQVFWNPAKRPGYSGTAILIKDALMRKVNGRVVNGLPVGEMSVKTVDQYGDVLNEGRVQTAEFEQFFLVNVYTPNAKPDLSRLKLRAELWDPGFLRYLEELAKQKPVVTCGDFNAAHQPIDLARPTANRHHAGFTDEERQGIDRLIQAGFVDSFRTLNPEEVRYTWWSHWGHARENNVGWRIDYFFVSAALRKKLLGAEIYEQFLGSDHCPISVEIMV